MSGPVERIEIGLLGPLEVRVAGRPVDVHRGRTRALLALLASAGGRPVPLETLAERIWGERPPADPRGSVYTTVRRLRRIFGPDAITSSAGGYALSVRPEDVDALSFDQLLDEADRADGDQALTLLRTALALWRGEPCLGQTAAWFTDVERPRLTERYLAAVERRVDLESGGRSQATLVGELTELTRRFPLRESIWLRLIRELAVAGRSPEALAAYESVRRLLADELGADPGAGLQSLYAELRASPLAAPEGVAPVAGSAVPRQLPAEVAGFTGRDVVLRRLDELRNRAPVVVIHGIGGVGKTSLAVHWVNRCRDDFPGGQVFVDLRGFGPGAPVEPAEALLTVLLGLGRPPEQIPADIDGRTALMRTMLAGRGAIVVLDNARDADQVGPLLPGTGTMVLATSRNQLRGLVRGEQVERIALETLSPPNAAALLTERLKDQGVGYDSVAVARLAELCGYLPLALTVAAERAGRYPDDALGTLVEFIGQLETERLDMLETGDDLSTSLRAVMSWSYRALGTVEAQLFRLLGIHPPGDIGVSSVAALVGADQGSTMRLLNRLLAVGLLDQVRTGRYAMHDLVRAYAAELAASSPSGTVEALRRMYNWYAWSAETARSALRGRSSATFGIADTLQPLPSIDDARSAYTWFVDEAPALRAALEGSVEVDAHHETILLARALFAFHHTSNFTADAADVLVPALAAARAIRSREAEGDTLVMLGLSSLGTHDLDAARRHLECALEIAREIDDVVGECIVLNNLGLVLKDLGRVSEAVRSGENAMALARRIDQPSRIAAALNNLAFGYLAAGRLEDARAAAVEAVDLRRSLGDAHETAVSLDTLGTVQLEGGDPGSACHSYEAALAIHRDSGSGWYEAYVLQNVGRALAAMGDSAQARASWEQALQLMDEDRAADRVELSRAGLRARLAELPPE